MRWPVIHGLLHSALMLMFAGAAFAQAYPSKPVRLIVPQPPGGGADIVARLIAQKLAEDLKQQVVVDNRAGAGGIVGTELVARAQPDGYTLLIGITGSLTINPNLYARLPYRPLEDFEPISLAVMSPYLLAVHASVSANNVSELIALAKSKAAPLTYSTPGNGSLAHLAMEWFRTSTNTQFTHVPYKGSAAFGAVVAGEIQVTLVSVVSGMPQIKSGRVKALAITSKARSRAIPELPTVAESGVAGFEATNWFGVLAPRGTPQPIIQQIYKLMANSARSNEVKERMLRDGADTVGGTPQEFTAFMTEQREKIRKIIEIGGLRGK